MPGVAAGACDVDDAHGRDGGGARANERRCRQELHERASVHRSSSLYASAATTAMSALM